jgi:hypothetical protein
MSATWVGAYGLRMYYPIYRDGIQVREPYPVLARALWHNKVERPMLQNVWEVREVKADGALGEAFRTMTWRLDYLEEDHWARFVELHLPGVKA